MGIKLVIDSASDISYEDAQKMGIEFLPLTIIFGDKEYKDGIELSKEEFYKKLESSDVSPKTSQVTPYAFQKAFQKIVDEGDTAIAITISSRLSGTYASAKIAAENFPGKVYVVDSLSATVGEAILIQYAAELLKTKDDPEEIISILEEKKSKVCILYLLDTLEYLYRGGRLSKFSTVAGSILSVKPIATINKLGDVELLAKARGFKKGSSLLRELIDANGGVDEDLPYTLVYSGNDSSLLDQYKLNYNDIFEDDISKAPVMVMGSTIGTHVGPGTIGLAFFTK